MTKVKFSIDNLSFSTFRFFPSKAAFSPNNLNYQHLPFDSRSNHLDWGNSPFAVMNFTLLSVKLHYAVRQAEEAHTPRALG